MSKARLLLGFFAGGLLLSAQNAPQASHEGVPVRVVVTVEGRNGHEANVPSLGRGDVLAYEGKERLTVIDFKQADRELALFVLLDDASSTNLGIQLDDLRRFIREQPATAAVGVGYMRNGMVNIAQDLSRDHEAAVRGLRLPLGSADAMTSPYLSLSDLIKRWPSGAARRVVVMLTSGIDPLGGPDLLNPYLDAAIMDAQRAGIPVYAIYMPAAGHGGHSFYLMYWGQNQLAKLTEETGGEAYMLGFGAPVSVGGYLDEISAHLAHQYVATVLMKPAARAGFRKVRFTTEVSGAELIAPAKVYVPAASGQPAR